MTEPSKTIEPIEDVVARDLSGWAKCIYNCTTGDNYLRTQEHYDIIRDLDRYASALTAAEAERDAAELRARNSEIRRAQMADVIAQGQSDDMRAALVALDLQQQAERERDAARAECERLREDANTAIGYLKDIGDWAHERSTGPAVQDDLWEIRRMAYACMAAAAIDAAMRGE